MTTVVYTPDGWVPLAGIASTPPDPEPTPPPAVIILSAISESPSELRVSWLAPTWGGGTVDHYQVDIDGEAHDWSYSGTSITIGDLDPDTTFEVAVRAVSGDGLVGPSTTTTGHTQQEIPTSNFPDVWDAMIASRDWSVVESTFDTYTGYQAAGYSYADLTPVAGLISTTHDGQVIEGVRCAAIRVAHSNVTIRGCLIGPGGLYGLYTNPTFGWGGTGLLVEHCTFDGTIGTGAAVDKAAVLMSANNATAATFRYCEITGFSSGFLSQGGNTVEYCWIHDFWPSSVAGAHVSSLNARGSNMRFYRNYATEGGSPICSIYFDQRPCNNVEIRENLLTARLSNSGNLPSYLLFFKQGNYATSATGTVVGGNYLGDTEGLDYQYGRTAQLQIVNWGSDGNVQTPNVDFLTGDPL